MLNSLRKIERWLREHQIPEYRDAPWILPRVAWRSYATRNATAQEIASMNVAGTGIDIKAPEC